MKRFTQALLVFWTLVGFAATATSGPAAIGTDIRSDRLRALDAEFLATGDKEGFWREVQAAAETGSYPFAEALQGTGRVRLTFLHRMTAEPPANVLLLANINHVLPAELLFRRLGDSGVYFKTVEVPEGVRFLYRIIENDPLTGLFAAAKYGTRVPLLGRDPDPLNPNKQSFPDFFGPGRDFVVTWVELDGAAPQPHIVDRGHPRGTVASTLRSSTTLGYDHQITSYLPPGYRPDRDYPLLILLDGASYFAAGSMQITLDNLLADGLIPPLLVLGVSAGVKDQQSQRNLEFTCNPAFMAYLNDELLPWFAASYGVSEDPGQRIIAGSSYGGLFATCFAFRHPETVAHVLSLSGSFHWGRDDDEFPYESLIRDFAFAEKRPIDLYMEVGVLEGEYSWQEPGFPHQIVSHRHFKTILDMKQYSVTYREVGGSHDMLSWRGGIADGLEHIFRSQDSAPR